MIRIFLQKIKIWTEYPVQKSASVDVEIYQVMQSVNH